MRAIKILVFYFLFCALYPTTVSAQTEETSAAEVLENYFRENEQPAESDIQEYVENLEKLLAHPLNLNRATREDLTDLHLLNELQVENLLDYRTHFGPLLNDLELQAVPGWELADIRRVLPFAQVSGGLDQRFTPIMKGFSRGENQLLARWGQTSPNTYPSTSEGGPSAIALRFRHNFDGRLRFGFTAEKDPGESFFRKSNKQGFDFYSAHLCFQNPNNWLKTLALGDFSARFGQGLLLQTGFALGKTAETSSIIRSGVKVRPYGSFGEAFFLRGAAATARLSEHWEITGLYSYRRRDANVLVIIDTTDFISPEERLFTSVQLSGLHRTKSEIENEKTLLEQTAGVSGTYLFRQGQISLNGLNIRYDKPWQPTAHPYNRFDFAGKSLSAASLDYAWHRRNFYFFGETARSDNGAFATVNGLLVGVDRRVTLSVLHRWLPPDYQSIYAAPFAETSGAANEQGLFLGADIRPTRPWQINVYADLWRNPWLSFSADGPSQGREYLVRVMWTKRKVMSAYVYWKMENKESSEIDGLAEHRTGRLRIHAQYRVSPGVELRSRAEWTVFQLNDQPRSHGFMAYQEAVFKQLGFPLSGVLRYALFDTDNFETRVFAYENDIFSSFSVPSFSGRGTRWYANLNWRVTDGFRLEARYEQTLKILSITEGSLPVPRNGVKILARWDF